MDASLPSISPSQLHARMQAASRPIVIDVRREPAFMASAQYYAGALRRDPAAVESWAAELPSSAAVVVYCVHGHEVSQNAARALRERSIDACYLQDGLAGWSEAGGAVSHKPEGGATCWVTRERPRIDRIACPWLVRRFVDRDARIVYVPFAEVAATAERSGGEPFDISGVALGHDGERCSFDAFIARFGLGGDPALAKLARIVRAADTGRPGDAAEAAGLLAVSQGLSAMYADDHEMLARATVVYDALHRCCREGAPQARCWNLANA